MKELPDGWRVVKLGDVCEINPSRPDLSRGDDEPTTFVPMSAIGERSGSIERPEVRRFGEVRKGYTYFEEGNVLFAKITPCMQNGKHAIARNLLGGLGFGTTELHVLRPSPEIIAEWIHAYVRQPAILEAATEQFTGTVGQQRLPEGFLESLEIPLPPLPEQQRIAGALREQMAAVDAARRSAEAQLKAAQALPGAYLRAVFTSPEAKPWLRKKLGELVRRISKGESPAWQGFEYIQAGIRFVRSENVLWGAFSFEPAIFIPPDFHAKLSRSQVRPGDILINLVGASIGRACVVPSDLGEANVNQAVGVITPLPDLDAAFLASFVIAPQTRKHFEDVQVEMARPNISLQNLHDLEIPLPPLADQQRIAAELSDQMAGVERLRRSLAEQLDAIEKLPAALLRRAFSGEL